MAKHNETGKKGEEIATRLLHDKGYRILATNYRYRRAEIDIIAKKEDTLVFVEVKTRKNLSYGHPSLFITPRKETLIIEAAGVYMDEHDHDGPIRFDIIAISIEKDQTPIIDHYEDAFFPGI